MMTLTSAKTRNSLMYMYRYYRKVLLRLCDSLREVETDPIAKRDTCLRLQQQVLERLTSIESSIRSRRREIETIRALLSAGRELTISKEEARRARALIAWHQSRIEEYQMLLISFRSLIDGLAFVYLDKWDIKQFALKESSGFISDKSGLDFELKILQFAFSSGHVALLNDLTNCLRHGDVTILANGRCLLVEAKSGNRSDARARRQESRLRDIVSYLESGKSAKFRSIGGEETEFTRVPMHGAEVDHRDRLNKLISAARCSRKHYSLAEVEPGLHYLATFVAGPEPLLALGGKPPGSLIVSFVNRLKYTGLGYYPFSLTIRDPQDWYDFSSGNLMLVVFVETERIAAKLKPHGISAHITGEWESYPLLLDSDITGAEPSKSKVGGHFFGRLFYEFLGLDWMLEQFIHFHNEGAQ